MNIPVRFLRAPAVALGAIAVFAVCDDLPTGPGAPEPPRSFQPMLNTALGGSATLVAAGDIAVCNTTSASTRNDDATAELVRALPDAAIATLGDHSVVASGAFITPADYTNCYGPSWGTTPDLLPRTHPTPGDRDWNAPAGSTAGQVYFDYFNGVGVASGPAGGRGDGYYAYDVGTWRVISLNSNISMAVNSPQYLWLKAELAANRAACTIAYWHAPRFFSAGATIRNTVKPLWDLLYSAGAEVILNSDNRFYERFAPQNPDGAADPSFGIREFIVGTGGIGTTTPLATPREHSEKLISPTFGVLALTLRDDGYDWEFRTIPGRALAQPETGSGTCHGTPLPTADANGPYSSERTVTFDGRRSFDPQGEALTYEWSFGDGATHIGSLPADATPTHTYPEDGEYTATLTVVDPHGDRSEPATTAVNIGNIPPSVNAGVDLWAIPNAQVTVRALFSDPGLEDGNWLYAIHWGDGTPPTTGELTTQNEPVVGSHSYSTPGTYSVTVQVTDKDDGLGTDVVSVQVSDQAAPTQVLTGAGDIAQCDAARMSEKTAKILKATPGTVFTIGDNAYPDGSAEQYRDCYGPGWGDPTIKSRTYAALGNHDYNTADATPSFDYFGAALGPRGKGYYSYDLGTWHVIVLNNNNDDRVPYAPGSAQFEWLKADLARSAATSRCTIVMAHQPYLYSSSTADGDGIRPKMKPVWEELYKWGVELIIAGDVHRYERFRPQSPEAEADDAYGIREFIVGTGGAGTSMPGTIRANSEAVSAAHGVLKLTLSTGQYAWEFLAVEGESFTDQGSGACHDPKSTTPVNREPVANADQYAVDEDNTLSVTTAISAIGIHGVLGNDVDADGDPLTATVLPGASPRNGTLELNGDGTFTYTPTLNFNGLDEFTYQVSDGKGGVATATVTITVAPVNDAPVANNDGGYGVAENQTLTRDVASGVLANDTDVEGSPLSAQLVQGPASGGLTLNADGSFTYTPNPNFNGTDSFQYRARDGSLQSNIAIATITVSAVNAAPLAVNDPGYTVAEDQTLTTAVSVLANDSDGDGDPLVAELVERPALSVTASFTLNPNGTFTFQPVPEFFGTTTFTYRATDGTAASGIATATITVNAINDAPSFVKGANQTVNEDAPAQSIAGWATNISVGPANESAQTVSFVVTNDNNTLFSVQPAVAADGTLSYALAPNANGTANVSVKAQDNGGIANGGVDASAMQTFTIAATAVNDAPSFTKDGNQTAADNAGKQTVNNWATNISAGPADESAQTLTFLVSNDKNTLFAEQPAISSSGVLTYTPAVGASGTAVVTVQLRDNGGTANGGIDLSAAQTFNITVNRANTAPVANVDAYSVNEDGTLSPAVPGVLGNDTDGESNPLTAILATGPAKGTLTLNTDGSFTYRPNANVNGSDSFTYRANDGALQSGLATVTITITALNDAPSFTKGGDQTSAEGMGQRSANNWATSISVGPADENGQSFSFILTNTNNALFSAQPAINSNGRLTYTAAPDANGTATVTVQLQDNGGTANGGIDISAPQTFTITVTAVNDAPVAVADSKMTAEDTPLTFAAATLTTNDAPGPVTATDEAGQTLTVTAVTSTPNTNGTVSLSAGNVTYTPQANFTDAPSFQYTVCDNGTSGQPPAADSKCATGTVNVTVTPVNDAPVAADNTYTTAEDTPLTVAAAGVLANDGDLDGDQLTAVLVSEPTNGTLTLSSDGGFSYTPNANYSGPDGFTYRAADGALQSNLATVTITITAVNDGPVARPQSVTTNEDTPATVTLAGEDPDGNPLSYRLIATPSHGTLSGQGNVYSYTPDPNYSGSDAFSFVVNDGTADSPEAAVSITVTSINDAPVAADNAYTTSEDTRLTVPAAGVLANDTDADAGAVLQAVLVTGPANGTVDLRADGSLVYTPNAQFHGTDSFTYKVTDGALESAAATVTITVGALNDAPVANGDSYTTAEDQPLTVAAPGVLQNDQDGDADGLSALLLSGPTNGTLTLNADGSFTYTPTAGYNGADAFTYQASDGNGGVATATATISVTPVNDAPVAHPQTVSTDEDTPKTITLAAEDADGNQLTYRITAEPSHGTLSGEGNVYTYTPVANHQGSDAFAFVANDGTEDSEPATVSISLAPKNDAPSAANDSYSTGEDQQLAVAASGVLQNDGDVDGDALSAVLVSGPTNGTLALNADGSFTYTPNANYSGTDSFEYRASDGTLASNNATVAIEVQAANDAPIAGDDSFSTDEDTPHTLSVLANDSDREGSQLTPALVNGQGPANGTVSLNADGTFTYTPNADFNGSDGFSYTVSDGAATSNAARVTITVDAVNDAPVAQAQDITTDEDGSATITLGGSDIENNPLAYRITAQPVHGILSGDGNVYTYTPNANYLGDDSFSFVANDGTDDSDIATVSITVSGVNDVPTAVADQYTLDEDEVLTVGTGQSVLANDLDADGDALTASLVINQGPSSGTLGLNSDGTFSYTPNANFHGTDGFTYQASDGSGSASTTVTITVNPVNDAPSFVKGDDQTVTENAGLQTVSGWATQISAGVNEAGQSLTFDVSSNNAALFATQPAVSAVTGDLTYTAAANAHGSATVTVTLRDDGGTANGGVDIGAPQTFAITVTAVNEAPTASANSYSTAEETTLTVAAPGILANDGDADGDAIAAALVAGPAHGTLTLNPDGSFTYTPAADFEGDDSFSYQATDPSGSTSPITTVSIVVTAVNDAPALQAVAALTASEGTPVTFTAAASDPDATALTYSLVGAPEGATIESETGTFTWTPSEAQAPGTFTFTVRVQDDATPALSDEEQVSITVSEANIAPVLNPIGAKQVVWGGTLTFTATASDADLPATPLTFSLVGAPSGATIDASTGQFSWTPSDLQGPGSYQVTVRVSDGALNTDEQIGVTVTNAVPTATSLSKTFAQAQATAPDFELDVAGTGFSPTSTVQWQGTTLATTFRSATSLTATVPGSRIASAGTYYVSVFNGTPGGGTSAKLAFFVTDAAASVTSSSVGTSNDPNGTAQAKTAGTSTVEAIGTGTGTVAVAQYSNNPGGIASFQATGLWFDVNVEGGSSFTQVEISFCNVADGTMVRWWNASTGTWQKVEPDAQLSGACLRMTVTSTSKPSLSDLRGDYFGIAKNAAPQAADDFATGAEDTPLTIHALANDSDADGGQLSSTLVDPTTNGTVVHNADGSFTYTPNANFSGTDRFTYKASDGALQSGVATVTITVTPTNDAPVAAADSYNADEDKQLTVAAPGVLANDVDADPGQTLRATRVSGPSNGTLVLNENGSFTYTPNTHFSGSDAFTYTTTDGVASSSAATVTITVKPRMNVTLDVIPGSSTNSIGYSSSQTQIVFAIVSSPTFDATLVEPATVTIGNELGTDTPLARNADGSFKFLLTDVNGDGRRDFYAYVNKADMKTNGDLTLATKNLTVLGGLKAPRTELYRGKDNVTVVP